MPNNIPSLPNTQTYSNKYCVVVLSRNGRHATKYLHIDMCSAWSGSRV